MSVDLQLETMESAVDAEVGRAPKAPTSPQGSPTGQAPPEDGNDGDGLPDDIEFAIGTSLSRRDTDGDGLDDFAEIEQGLDPLDGGLGILHTAEIDVAAVRETDGVDVRPVLGETVPGRATQRLTDRGRTRGTARQEGRAPIPGHSEETDRSGRFGVRAPVG